MHKNETLLFIGRSLMMMEGSKQGIHILKIRKEKKSQPCNMEGDLLPALCPLYSVVKGLVGFG